MTQGHDAQTKSEIRDGMRIDWDAPIPMDDGIVLRADVFRPASEGRYPVLLTYGPYAKGLAFQEGYPDAWETMARKHPDVVAGSTNLYQNWEVVTLKSGYRTATPACGWTVEAAGALPASSIRFRRVKHAILPRASPGPANNRGAAARSA